MSAGSAACRGTSGFTRCHGYTYRGRQDTEDQKKGEDGIRDERAAAPTGLEGWKHEDRDQQERRKDGKAPSVAQNCVNRSSSGRWRAKRIFTIHFLESLESKVYRRSVRVPLFAGGADSPRKSNPVPDLFKISRREFLVHTGAVAAGAAACRGVEAPAPRTMTQDELIELSATDAVLALHRGDFKAEDYAAALLARCEAGKHLNTFLNLHPSRVLEAARAADRLRASGAPLLPLHGLPIPIKDSVNTRDLPTTGGTPALRKFRPKEDAPLVRKLLDAGGIVMGKTNLHELSFGWSSNNLAFGAVKNPYDPTRIPGGSSGGTAAAVAARMAPLGVAEDTEGSIRVPAAMCGIYGFRPTTGRYPTTGVVPISPLFDQIR